MSSTGSSVRACSRASRSSRGSPRSWSSTNGSASISQASCWQHRQRVRARVDPVVAGARRAELAAVRQQLDARLLGVLDQRVRQLAGEQRGDPAGLRRDRLDQRLDRRGVEHGNRAGDGPEPAPVLDRRHEAARLGRDLADVPAARQGPRRDQVGLGVRRLLDRAHPRLAPPGRRPRRRAARRDPRVQDRAGHQGSRRSATKSRSSSLLSSVSAASPCASTASASARLRFRSSAIFSSMVPRVIIRCTCTGRVWPIR